MDTKKLLLIVLTIIGFSVSAYLGFENIQLSNTIASHENTISDLESDVSSLNVVVNGLSDELHSSQSDYEDAQEDISNLSGEVRRLETSMGNLQEENSDLKAEKISLQNDLDEIETSLSSLQSNYEELDGLYETLYETYNSLYETYESTYSDYTDVFRDLQIEQSLRIGNSLESYYDSLRSGLGPTGSENWWLFPTESQWQMEVEFAVNLAQHDLWRIYWPYYETDYEDLTGERSTESAWTHLRDVASHMNISSIDSPEVKIEKILSFLNENIHYELEINDVFLAPVETLGFKSGDCDDYSILAAALFEYFDVESAVGFFKNDANDYHAMVVVNLEDLGGHGFYYFDDLTEYGLPEGKWIMIEPQSIIEDQNDEDWMSQWKIFVAQELEN